MRFNLDRFSVNHTFVWFHGDNLFTFIGFSHSLNLLSGGLPPAYSGPQESFEGGCRVHFNNMTIFVKVKEIITIQTDLP
jgi:hypothetical protein